MRPLSAAALIASGMVIFSCDSNGDSAPSPSGANRDGGVIPDPDTIAPQITFRSPADGETNVPARAPIRITFSEAVKLGTTPATLMADNVVIPAAFELSEDRMLLSIIPNAELPTPAKISISLQDITDLRGNGLIRLAWTWTVPLWLQIGNTIETPNSARSPVMVSGPAEMINVVTSTPVDGQPGNSLLLRRIGAPKDVWSTVGTAGRTNGQRPSLAINKDGLLVVAFVDGDSSVVVDRRGGQYVAQPSRSVQGGNVVIAVDDDGLLFLANDSATDDGTENISVAALPHRAIYWTSLGTLNPQDGEKGLRVQSLTVDKSGTPYIAYLDSSDNARVRALSNGNWLPIGLRMNSDGERVTNIAIATDDSANLYALASFADRTLPRSRTQLLRFDGSTWTNCGLQIEKAEIDNPIVFGRTRNNHLFAYFDIASRIETLDVTRAGWTRIPPPALPSSPERKLTAGAGTIDPNGIPVIGWSESGQDLHVVRLNR